MGLFSSKTVINVSSVSYNIAGDAKDRTQFLKDRMVYFRAAGLGIAGNMSAAYRKGQGVRLKQAYRYAASLPQGVPSASIDLYKTSDLENEIQSLLDSEHGPDVYKVMDSSFALGDVTSTVEQHLGARFGWDPITNKMSRPPVDIDPLFTEDTNVQWGEYKKVPPGIPVPTFHDKITIELRHTNPNSALPDYSYEFVRPATHQERTVTLNVRVQEVETEEYVSLDFPIGNGTYPTLDAYYANRNGWNDYNSFFPVIPLRVENLDLMRDSNKRSVAYRQKIKLGKLLGVDVKALAEQINENVNIKDIDHAFLVIGANLGSKSKAEQDYLFHFWFRCWEYQVASRDEAAYAAWRSTPTNSRNKPEMNVLRIKDPEDGEKAYEIVIEWNYITKTQTNGRFELSPGKLAKKGDVQIIKGTGSQDNFYVRTVQFFVESSTITIRKQITDGYYISLVISGAMHKNYVYSGKTVETTAWNALNDPDEHSGFIVPLYMPIFNSLDIKRRTQLAEESKYMVFNCYKVSKKKWYQTGVFKIVLAIVLIVITVITWGGASGSAAGIWSAVANFAVSMGISAALLVALAKFAVGYVISLIIGKMQGAFISLMGERLGRIFAAIVTIVASIYAGGGNMSSAFTSGTGLVNAVNIINATGQVFSAYTEGTLIERQKDMEAYVDQVKEEQKKIDELTAGFFGDGNNVSIDTLLSIQQILREESPDVFISRTLMSSSEIIDMTYGMVSDMVSIEIHTRLPGV